MRGHRISILILTVLLTLGMSAPLSADQVAANDGLGVVVCTAVGLAEVDSAEGTSEWTLSGVGSCFGDRIGPAILTMEGEGTSGALGLCDGLLVTDLDLTVSFDLWNLVEGHTFVEQNWYSPVSTYPFTTPFLVGGDSQLGAGAISSRTRLNCGEDGSPAAQFTFAFLDI